MKKIIATTALTLMMSTSVFAANHTMNMQTYAVEQAGDIRASDFIGMRVYSAEKDFITFNNQTMVETGAEKEWDDIGEVNDIILNRDGSVKAVILGIGGFIGLGEKDIAVQMDQIKMVNEKDDAGDFFLVVNTNKEALVATEPFKGLESTMNDTMEAVKTQMDKGRQMLTAPTVEREGYTVAKMEDLTAEKLQGATLYGISDENIGEIDKLILTDDGKISKAVLDIGGFLGMGEHSIAVTLDELRIVRSDGGDDVRVYIDSTEDQLKKQPAYKG